jgi:DNA-binding beta-propeller fold protein YncE
MGDYFMSPYHRIPSVGTFHDVKMQGVALFAAMVALVAAAGCGTRGTNALSSSDGQVAAKVIGTINAGTALIAIAVDTSSNTIYAVNPGQQNNNGSGPTSYCAGVSGTLTTIDGATQSVTTSGLPYSYENPLALAVNSANHVVYVASRMFAAPPNMCYYYGSLQVLKGGALAQTATARQLATFSENVAVNQKTGTVYWSDWEGSSVAVLDANGNLLNTISLASRPGSIAVNATTNKIYVATTYPSTSVIVIDGSTDSPIGTITDPNLTSPIGLDVNASTNTIYVANGCSSTSSCNNLAVIDGATDSVTSILPMGNSAAAVAIDPQTNFIYVASAGNSQTGDPGNVTVINGATNATETLSDPKAQNPVAVAVNSATNKIYVANSGSNNVTVIAGAHN